MLQQFKHYINMLKNWFVFSNFPRKKKIKRNTTQRSNYLHYWLQVGISKRQMGHTWLCFSHLIIHEPWKIWEHGMTVTSDPPLNSSKHIVQLSSSNIVFVLSALIAISVAGIIPFPLPSSSIIDSLVAKSISTRSLRTCIVTNLILARSGNMLKKWSNRND